MKRGNFYIKLTTAVLFLAVAGYIGVYIYNAVQNTFVTAVAYGYSIEDTIPAQGYIIRSETVIMDDGAAILPIVNEGEKVASGQAIAFEHTGSAALKTAGEIRELRLRIAHFEETGAAAGSAGYQSVIELSKAVHSGNLSKLDEISLRVRANVFAGDDSSDEQLSALKAQLANLESQSTGVRTIYAPAGGVFSQTVDGYEHIGPSGLAGIKPSALDDLFEAPSRVSDFAGKLVTDFRWYYAAVMDAADVVQLPLGKNIKLQFLGAYHTSAEMLVENIGRKEDDKCVVLFSSSRGIHDVTTMRQLSAEVVISDVAGIRVPREAIRLDDDGATYIFLQSGVRAERVNVEILYEFADGYLLRDGAETGAPLRSGSTIIVKANNLYDGKVVG